MKSRKTTERAGDRHQRLLSLYRTMTLIRQVEQALIKLFADGEVPGFIHLSIGQEAIAAGIAICGAGQRGSLAFCRTG